MSFRQNAEQITKGQIYCYFSNIVKQFPLYKQYSFYGSSMLLTSGSQKYNKPGMLFRLKKLCSGHIFKRNLIDVCLASMTLEVILVSNLVKESTTLVS